MKKKIELHFLYAVFLASSGIVSIAWGHDLENAGEACQWGDKIATDSRDRIATEIRDWIATEIGVLEPTLINEQIVEQSLIKFFEVMKQFENHRITVDEPIVNLFPMGETSMAVYCFLQSSDSTIPVSFNYHWNSVMSEFQDYEPEEIKRIILGYSLRSLAYDNQLIPVLTPYLDKLSERLETDISQVVWYLAVRGLIRIQTCMWPTNCRRN